MDKLETHIHSTYFALRVGIAMIAISMPLILYFGGKWHVGTDLLESMSAYYVITVDDKSMRDWFVGILFVIGSFLFLYRGFSRKEDRALNLAGLFEIGVAIFPTDLSGSDKLTLHGFCAISFFLCISYVCIWRAGDTLSELNNPQREKRYRMIYGVFGLLMVLSPGIAWLLTVILRQYSSLTFFVETVAVWVFGSYWIVKSMELSESSLEKKLVAAN